MRTLRCIRSPPKTERPALEYATAWAGRVGPNAESVRLCHGDFRTGNLMVDGPRLIGMLDWEFVSSSRSLEDLGWFCARCRRFGAPDEEAGGLGSHASFLDGYVEAPG